MRFGWFPWKYLIRRAARKHGFLDPIALVSRLRKFAQPADVTEPIELIRAGVLFHARGLINTRAIQHNLDWIWPYWVERQFDPYSRSFIPRAFSVTHVNLTHRNWTAVGLPGCDAYPVVDPRGLVTPHWDGWSIDAWITAEGRQLIPSRVEACTQTLQFNDDNLTVTTLCQDEGLALESRVTAVREDGRVFCDVTYHARMPETGLLVLALRPYNPEGVAFMHDICFDADRCAWIVNRKQSVFFRGRQPAAHSSSNYHNGDVWHRLDDARASGMPTHCDIGLATAAALVDCSDGGRADAVLRIPLVPDCQGRGGRRRGVQPELWRDALADAATLQVPDPHVQFLYEAAVRTLVLLSPGWMYPGPYTYRRFWYRDAVFVLNALLAAGLEKRTRALLERFPEKQQVSGYFHSQEGEWDSNGEVLWIFARYHDLTAAALPASWLKSIVRGGEWIRRKRLAGATGTLHKGLLPPGFSAEHFGNIDYYYWDDYWAVAGLRDCARLLDRTGDARRASAWRAEADMFMQDIDASIAASQAIRNHPGIPASPYRRMDAGAVGVLAASYPLELLRADDPRLQATVRHLMDHCLVHNAFFQDMIHSGMNMYLTLHLAQLLMRVGDPRFLDLVRAVAGCASSTGQWPEAIHPITGGGCMGDGQHAWAAAEWVMMMRNMFVYESTGGLVVGAGMPPDWLNTGQPMRFGPTLTPYGSIAVDIVPADDAVIVGWKAAWRGAGPAIRIALPGIEQATAAAADPEGALRLARSRTAAQ